MWLMLGRTDLLSMMDWAINWDLSKAVGDEVQVESEWSFMINDSFYIYPRWMRRHVPWLGWARSTMDDLIINVKELSSDDVKGRVSSRDAWKWLWQIKVELTRASHTCVHDKQSKLTSKMDGLSLMMRYHLAFISTCQIWIDWWCWNMPVSLAAENVKWHMLRWLMQVIKWEMWRQLANWEWVSSCT